MKKKLFFPVIYWCFLLLAFNANAQWTQKANVGGSGRTGGVGFSIGSKGYIGTGYTISSLITNDFWEYDPATNVWSQKANVGGPGRHHAVGFSIGSKGYIGTGATGIPTFLNDFWEYDPATNTWTQKTNFAGAARQFAVGFSIGSKGYIGTGHKSFDITTDFWEYDPATNAWTQKADLAGAKRTAAVGFSIGSKGYIGTGQVGNPGTNTADFWEYDPATNGWTQKASFPGVARDEAVGFSIGTKGYIGTGLSYDGNNYHTHKDFWQYDPSANLWVPKANLTGQTRLLAVGFSIGTKGYIGTGVEIGTRLNDFWEYTPPAVLSTGSLSSNFYCNASLLNVPYSSDWLTFNSGNVFTAQISNSSGAFTGAYYNIGTLTSTATSGTINAQIPSFVSASSNYRIRVISSNPAVNGTDNGTNLTMGGTYAWTGDLWTSGDQTVYLVDQNQGYNYICDYTTAYFKVNGATSASQYALASGNVTWDFGVSYPGYVAFYMPPGSYAIFTVTINSGGCTHVIYFNFAATSCAGRSYYTIAPNPVVSELNLYADGEEPKNSKNEKSSDRVIQQVIILDKSGNELRRQNYPSNTKKITLSVGGLSPGIYVARVFDGKKWTSVKFIKK